MRMVKVKPYPLVPTCFVSAAGEVFIHNKDGVLQEARQTKLKKTGYMVVRTKRGSFKDLAYVHRMVLMAWVGMPEAGNEAAHLDGSRDNNVLSNLKWCTAQENSSHMVSHGTLAYGDCSPTSKLNKEEVLEIKELLKNGGGGASIARRYHVTKGCIHAIEHGITWKDA